LIDNRDGEVVSLANGCICCSLSEGLLMSVVRLVRSEDPPEHILVETSGISDPIEVARTFGDPELQPYAPLEGVVTVVDAELAPTLDAEMLRLAHHQARAANVVVLNKVDLVDATGLQEARAWVTDRAPHVRVVEVSHGRVPLELLFDIGGVVESCGAQKPRGSAGGEHPPFDTYTYESKEPVSVHRLHSLLSRLPKAVFRAKGIVNLIEKPDHPCVLQSTARRADLTVGQPWGERSPVTQIVFIGARKELDGEWISDALS
jgi:G3E family GTPase